MSKINLLPKKIKEDITYSKRNASMLSWLVILLVISGILGLFAGFIFFIQTTELINTRKELSAKEIEKDAASTITIDGKKINVVEESTRLDRKIKAIKTIEKDQLRWSRAIEELSVLIPDSVYINALPLNTDPKIRIAISGFAVDQLSVATYRNALENSELFKNVDIVSISKTDDQTVGGLGYGFSINMSLENINFLKVSQP